MPEFRHRGIFIVSIAHALNHPACLLACCFVPITQTRKSKMTKAVRKVIEVGKDVSYIVDCYFGHSKDHYGFSVIQKDNHDGETDYVMIEVEEGSDVSIDDAVKLVTAYVDGFHHHKIRSERMSDFAKGIGELATSQ